jgi:FkbM family methyltransferase
MVTIDDLQAMYRYILGREMNDTELERVTTQVLLDLGRRSIDDIRNDMLVSDEFMIKHKFQFLSRLLPRRAVVAVQQADGSELYVDLRQKFIGWGVLQGSYEQEESALVRRLVGAGMNVIDVGANIGYFTIMMAGLVGTHGRVDAVEPVKQSFELLQKSVSRNDYTGRVHLHKSALSSHEQEIRMRYQPGSTNMGGAYMRPDNSDDRLLGKDFVEEAARATTLDFLAQDRRIDFIKIDVEGAEPLVIAGGREMLLRDRPTILMEVNEPALHSVSGVHATWIFEMAADLKYDVYPVSFGADVSAPLDPLSLRALMGGAGLCNVVLRRPDRGSGIAKS